MIETFCGDNKILLNDLAHYPNLIYADCIYERTDFSWAEYCYRLLKPHGIFILQTDYHTVAQWKIYLDSRFGKENFVNWMIYKQEWGGVSKRFFPRKHDDILIYSKGKDYKFYYNRVMIPKVTAGTKLDKRGDGLKIPCDVMDDLGNFSTVSKERIKMPDGKSFKWQKPQKLFDRLIAPFTDDGDLVLDPFMGVGSLGKWCKKNDRDYIGMEIDKELFEIARDNINS